MVKHLIHQIKMNNVEDATIITKEWKVISYLDHKRKPI